jgi:hypothetical protein
VLATVTQIGGALGVAPSGSVFYGALGTGAGAGHAGQVERVAPAPYAHAFEPSLIALTAGELLLALLVQFLPRDGAETPAS